jgi:hypothetical protein
MAVTVTARAGTNPFNTDPSGPFFAGRERELLLLRQWLSAIRSQPQHACVVGRPGGGKTSFLQKAKSEAASLTITACSTRIDAKRSANQNINTIIQALLDEIDLNHGLELRKNWTAGTKSTFRTPQSSELRTDDLVKDLQMILAELEAVGRTPACLFCIDDGQAIDPAALSTLRNALPDVRAGYMLLMALRNDSIDDAADVVEGPRMIAEFATLSTDTGLPRLFADNYISMGAFENQLEAEECIRKRLTGTPISFAETVIRDIGRITGRQPNQMMILAKSVYALAEAKNSNVDVADAEMLREAFIITQKPLVDAATVFCAGETNTKKKVYLAALERSGSFTPTDLAKDMLGTSGNALSESDFAADPVSVALERLVSERFCARSGNDQYELTDPLRAHALRIALA